MKTLIAIAALVLMANPITAYAGSQPELPAKDLGHWCYDGATGSYHLMGDRCDNPVWLNIHPTGFAMSDGPDGPKMYCTLKSTSLKLDVFMCNDPASYETRLTTTEHMRLHIDGTGTLHLGWKTGASK